MKSKFTTVAVLALFSATYCRAGLFDKALNAANALVKPDAPSQEPAAKPSEPIGQVVSPKEVEVKSVEQPKEPDPVKTAPASVPDSAPQPTPQPAPESAGSTHRRSSDSASESAEPKTEPPATSASPQKVKAFKSLNFGDNRETVIQKLAEIGAGASYNASYQVKDNETFWKALFDTDAEYEPFKPSGNYTIEPSAKFKSLSSYFGGTSRRSIQVEVVSGKNEAIEVNCFALDVMRQDQLGHPINTEILQDDLGLVVVEITYVTFNTEKLVADFSKNFPNARKETKHEKVELLPLYPGAFIEYDKPVFSDVNQERRATLTLSPEKITTTFAPSSTLSESDKTLVLEQVKKQKPDAPTVVFASKRILDLHMNNFRKAIAAADQAKKDKAKKAAESSSGF